MPVVALVVASMFGSDLVAEFRPPDRSAFPPIAAKFLTPNEFAKLDDRVVRSLWRSQRALDHVIRMDGEGRKAVVEVNDILRGFNHSLSRVPGFTPIPIESDPAPPPKKK